MQFSTTTYNASNHACSSLETAYDDAADIVLPASYTEILPCILPSATPVIPPMLISLIQSDILMKLEYEWLNSVNNDLKGNVEAENLSWAAFHAE